MLICNSRKEYLTLIKRELSWTRRIPFKRGETKYNKIENSYLLK